MSRMVFVTGTVVIGIAAYLSLQLFSQGQAMRKQAVILEKKNTAQEKRLTYLEGLSDSPVGSVIQYYEHMYEYLKIWSTFYGWKDTISVAGLGVNGAIDAAVAPSAWEGVGQLSLKMDFYEVTALEQYLSIFQALRHLQEMYPLNVVSIDQKGKDLQIMAQIYGRNL